jgi:hypothetical protein
MGCTESKLKPERKQPIWEYEEPEGSWRQYEPVHQVTLEEQWRLDPRGSVRLWINVNAGPAGASSPEAIKASPPKLSKRAKAEQKAAPSTEGRKVATEERKYCVDFAQMQQTRVGKWFPKKRQVQRREV